MNFAELTAIIQEIKRKFCCPHCRKKFNDKSIHVLGTSKFDGTFYILCQGCKAPMLLSVFLSHVTISDIPKELNMEIHTLEKPISSDDILDMHNFLKNFPAGDIRKFIQ